MRRKRTPFHEAGRVAPDIGRAHGHLDVTAERGEAGIEVLGVGFDAAFDAWEASQAKYEHAQWSLGHGA